MRSQASRLLALLCLRSRPIHLLQPRIDRRLFSQTWKQNEHTCLRPSPPCIDQNVGPKEASLAWIQLHDHTPAGYGVDTFFGYIELIPPNVALPCKATQALESAFDYLKSTDIPVCYRASMLHAPTQITHITLNGLRIAEKQDTRLKVRMEIGKDLVGTVTAWDVFTRSTAVTKFDGKVAIPTQGVDKAVLNRNS